MTRDEVGWTELRAYAHWPRCRPMKMRGRPRLKNHVDLDGQWFFAYVSFTVDTSLLNHVTP